MQNSKSEIDTATRRRGRPKTTGASGRAEELRREQIRRAQRTYRLRRENKALALEEAHADLVAKYEAMEQSFFSICEEAAKCDSTGGPLATMIQQSATRFFGDRLPPQSTTSSSPTSNFLSIHFGSDMQLDDKLQEESSSTIDRDFGYIVGDDTPTSTGTARRTSPGHADYASWPSDGSSAGGSSLSLQSLALPNTCSYLEASFARRLQRCSLELAYQIFIDPRAEPRSVYRIFRLVPCFKDRQKMEPYFEKLVRAEYDLELYGLPFYCIGGAGKHYPRTNRTGDPETPPNLRLPKRLLGICPRDSPGTSPEACEESLRRMGYGGIWLDSYEVECYLKERGIWPRGHLSIVPVRPTYPTASGNFRGLEYGTPRTPSSIGGVATTAVQDERPRDGSDPMNSASTRPLYFDMGRFVECLCTQASILGRAPGFRKDAVDAAIRRSLQRG